MSDIQTNKQKAILQAAEQEFLKKGFDGAKTQSIAAAAGVTHAMLHYYFGKKETLFNYILDEKITLLQNSILDAFYAPTVPFLERIRMGIEAHFEFFMENKDLPHFIINEFYTEKHADLIQKKVQSKIKILIENMQQECDKLYEEGILEKVNVTDIILDIISLNISIFMAYPILNKMFVPLYGGEKAFYEARKRENVNIIMKRILKQPK